MRRSMIDVHSECLPAVLPHLRAAVKIVGSEAASDGVVRLVIEGEVLPDAEMVECVVSKQIDGNTVRLTTAFSPSQPSSGRG